MNGPHVIPDIEDYEESVYSRNEKAETGACHNAQVSRSTALSIQAIRERQGRCGQCGIQTHFLTRDNDEDSESRKLMPLTIADQVLRGRCLLCHPIPNISLTFPLGEGHGEYRRMYNINSSTIPLSGISCIPNTMPGYFNNDGNDNKEYTYSGCSLDLCDTLYTMKRYPNEASIQQLGCEALWVQSWEDDMSRIIGKIGGIDRIIDAMVRFPKHYGLVLCACEALQNLSLTTCNRNHIVRNEGVSVIIQTAMAHISSVEIQRACCSIIVSLATSSDHRVHIRRVDGDFAIAASLGMHPEDPEIQYCASKALNFLGFWDR